jgi:hypothetical protein
MSLKRKGVSLSLRASRIATRMVTQHALEPDAAPLRFAAQVKRRPLGRPRVADRR